MIAADATWTVNGNVQVAQEYVGRERIFDLFRETRRLTDGTYLSTLRWSLAYLLRHQWRDDYRGDL